MIGNEEYSGGKQGLDFCVVLLEIYEIFFLLNEIMDHSILAAGILLLRCHMLTLYSFWYQLLSSISISTKG